MHPVNNSVLQAIRDGADAVIAVGGDGTLHEVWHLVLTVSILKLEAGILFLSLFKVKLDNNVLA